jgi:hypothetical protein
LVEQHGGRDERGAQPALRPAEECQAALAVGPIREDDDDRDGGVIAAGADPDPDPDLAATDVPAVSGQRLEAVCRARVRRCRGHARWCRAVSVRVMGGGRRVWSERFGEAQPGHVAEQGGEAAAGADLDD